MNKVSALFVSKDPRLCTFNTVSQNSDFGELATKFIFAMVKASQSPWRSFRMDKDGEITSTKAFKVERIPKTIVRKTMWTALEGAVGRRVFGDEGELLIYCFQVFWSSRGSRFRVSKIQKGLKIQCGGVAEILRLQCHAHQNFDSYFILRI